MDEVCEQLDLKNVDITYNDGHYQNLVTYKMFTQFVRPILQKENPKAPSSKLMMLIAAKWREFCEENPNLRDEEGEQEEKSEEEEEDATEEQEVEYQRKPSRSRASKVDKHEEVVEEDSDDDKRKKRSSVRVSNKKGKKQKVPTLKIRFGKKKDASSDEEKVWNIVIKQEIKHEQFPLIYFRTVMQVVKSVIVTPSLKKCCLKLQNNLMTTVVDQHKVQSRKEKQKLR